MTRPKTRSEVVALRRPIVIRLAELRTRHFGSDGIAACAHRVGVPHRSWYNYEHAVAVPGEVILRVIEATNGEPMWLLYGREPMYREPEFR
jgi:hypothetical protein